MASAAGPATPECSATSTGATTPSLASRFRSLTHMQSHPGGDNARGSSWLQQRSVSSMASGHSSGSHAQVVLHHHPSTSDSHVPHSLFWTFPRGSHIVPSGRWAHAAAAVGKNILVHGGIGTVLHDDLWSLDTETLQWRMLSPGAATPKDKPEQAMGHAAAVVGHSVWLFGGQQGRSLLRKLHVLDTELMVWRRVTASSDTLPSARAGHAMVSVPGFVYLFGGQGKKMLNDMHRLDPETGAFSAVRASGRLPLPRRGMSLVYDGRDSLICFGGMHSTGIDAALSVFSLSTGEWHHPAQQGTPPSPRTNHSAVLLAPQQVLIIGGCNAQGTFFNDAYILDTRSFTWHRPQVLNTAPAPRYCHSCCVVNGRAYVYGGINAKQTFDGVVALDTRFDNEISHIAEELRALTAAASSGVQDRSNRSVASNSAVATVAAPATEAPSATTSSTVDVMKVQLMDLLYKRNIEELHAQASSKAEAVEQMLSKEREAAEVLKRENLQLKILAAEAEEATTQAEQRARAAQAQAAKATTALSEVRAALEAKDRQLSERQAEVESAHRLHQGLVKELGLVASRYAKLQQQHRRKAPTRNTVPLIERVDSTGEDAFSSLSGHGPMLERVPASGDNSQAVSESDGGTSGQGTMFTLFDRRSTVHHSAPLQFMYPYDRMGSASLAADDASQQVVPDLALTTSTSSLGPNRQYVTHWARPQQQARADGDLSMLSHFDDILSLLGDVGQQKDELQAQVSSLTQQLAESEAKAQALALQLQRLQATPEALHSLSSDDLAEVEQQLEAALKRTREAMLERRMAEAQRAVTEQQCCSLCLEQPRGVVFSCGHQSCSACSERLVCCPFCRTAITTRIKLYDS